MNFPPGCYRKNPSLKVRELPELDTCLAYVPRPPRLCQLNLTSWLILELCDGRAVGDLRKAYCEATERPGDSGQASLELEDGLRELVELGVLHHHVHEEGNPA